MTAATSAPASRPRPHARPARPRIERTRGWWTASLPADPALSHDLGRPGPWRTLRGPRGRERLVLEVPEAALARMEPDGGPVDGPQDAEAVLRQWVRATAPGSPGAAREPAWSAPGEDELHAWLPAPSRRVRVGPHARAMVVASEAGRLSVAVPDLARLAPELAPARHAWLAAACLRAQERWRLVRFGVVSDEARVAAEVDLTGVPAALAPRLVPIAAAALATATAWALPGLAAAADPHLTSTLLATPPPD